MAITARKQRSIMTTMKSSKEISSKANIPIIQAALHSALAHLMTCNDCEEEAAELGNQAIRKIQEALNSINTQTKASPVVVVVSDGAVTGVYGEDGTEYECCAVVDHDNEGCCPVCQEEFDDSNPCPECGYDPEEENEVECAIEILRKTK